MVADLQDRNGHADAGPCRPEDRLFVQHSKLALPGEEALHPGPHVLGVLTDQLVLRPRLCYQPEMFGWWTPFFLPLLHDTLPVRRTKLASILHVLFFAAPVSISLAKSRVRNLLICDIAVS